MLLYVHRTRLRIIRDGLKGAGGGGGGVYLWIARPYAPTLKDRRDRYPRPEQ